MATTTATTIDFRAVAERVNLRAFIESEQGPANSSRKWSCPFHDDRDPSLTLAPDGRRFKCWSCGAGGTVLDWIMARDGVSVVEAARQLDPSLPSAGSAPAEKRQAPARRPFGLEDPASPAWMDPAWQKAADEIIRRAEDHLRGPEGAEARRYLRWRKIGDGTARRFRLGFLPDGAASKPLDALPDDRGRPRPIRAPRGITVPWVAPGAVYDGDEDPGPARWVGVNVRRLADDVFAELPKDCPKCQAFAGSSRGYGYPWPDLAESQEGPPALVVEGEFDALVGWQELGHMAHVFTFGGSNQSPRTSALTTLDRCPWWLLSFDHDIAGQEAVRAWREHNPSKCRRLVLPFGKDLNAFAQEGGDVAGWLAGEMSRIGIN